MEKFEKIKPYGEDSYAFWISGIYKIVSYRPGEYNAFFIQDHYENWGDHVCPPPHDGEYGKVWKTLAAAKEDCEKHSQKHQPSLKTIRRAKEIKAALLEQAAEYATPNKKVS